MKKVLIFILLLFSLSLFVSCKKEKEKPKEETKVETKTEEKTKEATLKTEYYWEETPIDYTFGDSIAYGYGLIRRRDRFSDVFCNLTNMKNINRAVSGEETGDLIELMKDLTDLNIADMFSICIGSNNLLHPTMSVFSSYATTLLQLLSSGDKEKLMELFVEINEKFNSQSFDENIAKAVAGYERDIYCIIDLLYNTNPDAEIYMQNIYNPFMGFTYSEDGKVILGLEAKADEIIGSMNVILERIVKEKHAEGVKIYLVDVFNAFKNTDVDPVNANFSFKANEFKYDPHPTKEGQEVIAKTYYEVWKENTSLKGNN